MGKRAGAATVGLDTWHLDLEHFLELQTETGDFRNKAPDVFLQLIVSDEFMRRVESNELWTLLDPYEVKTKLGIDLADLWGPRFEEAYKLIEASLAEPNSQPSLTNHKLTLYKKVNAKDVFKNV